MWKIGEHLHTIEVCPQKDGENQTRHNAMKNDYQPDLSEFIIHKIFAQNILSYFLLLCFVIIIFLLFRVVCVQYSV